MKILIINGPNLNMLGIREPELYGKNTFACLKKEAKTHAKQLNIKVSLYQSNHEGDIVTKIQRAYNKFDGIIINAGAYTHTSIAILDALKAVNIPTVEVHITNFVAREEFRKISYVSYFAEKVIKNEGITGYLHALDYFANKEKN